MNQNYSDIMRLGLYEEKRIFGGNIEIVQFVRRECQVRGGGHTEWTTRGFQCKIWSRFLKLSEGQTGR
jgi:hypothetical protein